VKRFAWGGNIGWIDWRADGATAPAGAVTVDAFLSGLVWSANCGWINLGDGSPANGYHYANTTGEDSGVNVNADGTLTGLAWGANIGWIVFEQTTGHPRLDYQTGEFRGHAWSANGGWINLGNGQLFTDHLLYPDSDGDGMSDTWEREHFSALNVAGPNTDTDGDGQTDAVEFNNGSDPEDRDSVLTITGLNVDVTEVYITVENMSRNRLYTLESSDDLTLWSAVSDSFPGIGLTGVFDNVIDPADRRWYWRVTAKKPLP
jgi:hypothetical protein